MAKAHQSISIKSLRGEAARLSRSSWRGASVWVVPCKCYLQPGAKLRRWPSCSITSRIGRTRLLPAGISFSLLPQSLVYSAYCLRMLALHADFFFRTIVLGMQSSAAFQIVVSRCLDAVSGSMAIMQSQFASSNSLRNLSQSASVDGSDDDCLLCKFSNASLRRRLCDPQCMAIPSP